MDSFPVLQSSSSPSTEYKRKIIEDQLIDIGGWAIQSVKMAGFFPLHIYTNANTFSPISGTPTKTLKQIKMRNLNICSSYLWFLNLVGIFFIFYGFVVSYKTITSIHAATLTDESSKTPNAFSDEEDNFLATYNGLAMVTVSAFLRFKYLLSPKKTLEFWNQFVKLLHGFNDLNIFSPGTNHHFNEAKGRVKKFSGIFILITVVQTGIMFSYVYRLFSGKASARGRYLYDNPDKIVSFFVAISSLLLILFVHLQVGLFIWVGFIIEMHATCFKAIGTAVEFEISKKDCKPNKKDILKSGWSKSHIYPGGESRLRKLLGLFEDVWESTEKLNRFYSLPMMIDVFVCITNSFASIYVINKMLYLYGLQKHEAMERQSSWDQIVDLLHRLPSHWAFTYRAINMSLAGNSVTQESLKVIQFLEQASPKCRWVLDDFALQSQVKTVVRNLEIMRIHFTVFIKLTDVVKLSQMIFQIQMLVTRASIKPPGISPGNFFTLSKSFMVSVSI